MLNDKIIPIGYPQSTIRTYLCLDGRRPLIRTHKHVPSVTIFPEACTVLLKHMLMYKTTGRLGYKCNPVPVFFWKSPGCIKSVTSCRSEPAMYIYLPEIFSSNMHRIVSINLF